MGHMLKNTVIRSGSYAAGIPVGSNTIGPDAPVAGQARWNTSTSRFEYFDGVQWKAVAHEGAVTIVKDSFIGTGVDNEFGAMSYSYDPGQEAQVLVFLNTVFQNPGVNYNFNGTANISFTSTPLVNSDIVILHNMSSTIAA